MIAINEFKNLRRRAEEVLKEQSNQESYHLIKELNLHQVELEMQNEDLMNAQHALQYSKDKSISVYELSPIAYFTFDSDGLISEVNQVGSNLLGIKKESLINRCFSRYVLAGYQSVFSQCCMRAFNEMSAQTCELKLLRWTGPEFYAQIDCKAIYNLLLGKKELLVFITDISDQKSSEESRNQEQKKMAALDRMQSMNELINSISRTQNHSLTVIKNYVYGCIRRIETNNFSLDDLLSSLKKVSEQARLLSEVILRMKSFTSKGIFTYELGNIHSIINETVALINFETSEFPISLIYESSTVFPSTKLDKLHIQQIILNLARNSIEAMRDAQVADPKLVIESVLLNDELIEISMCDNGPGFNDENTDYLFEPHCTTKPYGIGLGLSVSRSIIEKHGGQLTAKTNPTGGACFLFTLPIVESIS